MRQPPRIVSVFCLCLFLVTPESFVFAAPPDPPTNLIASVNGSTLQLAWTGPSSGGSVGYVIEASLTSGGAPIASVATFSTSLVVPHAPAGTFFIRIRATNQDGASGPSNEAAVTIVACGSAPNPPTLSGGVTNTLVSLSWLLPGGGCAPTHYIVRAGSAPGLTNVASVNVGVQTVLTANAPPGVYYLTVVAVNEFGTSAASNEVSITVGDSCALPPSSPQHLTAHVVANTVTLAWNPPVGGCAPTSYLITAGLAPGNGSAASVQIAGTSLTVLAPNGTFYVRVFATNRVGSSGPSNEVTLVVGPPAPGVLQINESTVTLTADGLGDALVIGQVTNNSPQLVTFPEVSATFRNAGGGLVGNDSTFVIGRSRRLSSSQIITDTSLAPGESGCFIMFTNFPATGVATATLSINFDTFTAANLAGSIVLSGPPIRSSSLGELRLDGLVANTGSRLTYFTEAVFLVKNVAGRALDCDTTFVNGTTVPLPGGGQSTSGVPVGQTAPYRTFTRAPFGQDAVITGWTLWEEFGTGSDAVAGTIEVRADEGLSRRERAELRDEREGTLQRQLRRQGNR